MFEYILAGFTGSFFSYFCVFVMSCELNSFAGGTISGNVISVINSNSNNIERKLDRIVQQINQNEKKMDQILQKN
jgi:hypothetical protein